MELRIYKGTCISEPSNTHYHASAEELEDQARRHYQATGHRVKKEIISIEED